MEKSDVPLNIDGRKIKLEYVSCNLCGSSNVKEVLSARDERFKTSNYEFSVVKCESCGLVYLNPRPYYESMEVFYPSKFFLKRDNSEQALNKYGEELKKINRSSGRILDIGCANGGFVCYAQKHGFKAEGLEVSKNATNPYKMIIHKLFKDVPDISYDVVTGWAVFEHLHNPMEYFKEVERVLKHGGEFIFLVPNFASYRSSTMKYEDIPRHLYFFTPLTAKLYLEEAGLKLENIEQENSIYYGGHRKFMVYLGLRLLRRPFTYRHQKNLWKSFRKGITHFVELIYLLPFEHLDRFVHRKVTKWFANRGMNGTMIVHARKP